MFTIFCLNASPVADVLCPMQGVCILITRCCLAAISTILSWTAGLGNKGEVVGLAKTGEKGALSLRYYGTPAKAAYRANAFRQSRCAQNPRSANRASEVPLLPWFPNPTHRFLGSNWLGPLTAIVCCQRTIRPKRIGDQQA